MLTEECDDDDDLPQLSAQTFLALQEFYKEEENRELNKVDAEKNGVINITEDWQLSQFWYNSETIDVMVNLALGCTEHHQSVALISCPSLYQKMKKLGHNRLVHLYEFDKRFAVYGGDFTFYDYKDPLNVPKEKREYYDLVIADPPFLSDECLTKTAVTIKYLAKNRIMLCTGATMAEMANRLLNLKKTAFHPQHQNNLANEFCCYTNFDIDTVCSK